MQNCRESFQAKGTACAQMQREDRESVEGGEVIPGHQNLRATLKGCQSCFWKQQEAACGVSHLSKEWDLIHILHFGSILLSRGGRHQVQGEPVVVRDTAVAAWEQRKVDWGFILEGRIDKFGRGWMWVARVAGSADALLAFWPGATQVNDGCHFLRWGRRRRSRLGRNLSLLLDMLGLSYYLSAWFIADRAPWVSEAGQKEGWA